VTDTVIAVLISYKLLSSRRGFNRRTDHILSLFSHIAISSGAVTAVCAIAVCVFTYYWGNATYVGVALIMILPRLYACCVRCDGALEPAGPAHCPADDVHHQHPRKLPPRYPDRHAKPQANAREHLGIQLGQAEARVHRLGVLLPATSARSGASATCCRAGNGDADLPAAQPSSDIPTLASVLSAPLAIRIDPAPSPVELVHGDSRSQ
jgi:hypothetical protein